MTSRTKTTKMPLPLSSLMTFPSLGAVAAASGRRPVGAGKGGAK